jgi:hypothetical protein
MALTILRTCSTLPTMGTISPSTPISMARAMKWVSCEGTRTMAGSSAASKKRMALFSVSVLKPECSMSKNTKSQPADLRMCPIPGVANSATR